MSRRWLRITDADDWRSRVSRASRDRLHKSESLKELKETLVRAIPESALSSSTGPTPRMATLVNMGSHG
jgi:hypothetical protein